MPRSIYLPLLFALGAAGMPTAASAQNAAVTCQDLAIHLGGLTADTGISFTLPPEELVARCTSSTNAPLTLSGVSKGPYEIGGNIVQSLTFTVKDDNGNTAQASVLVTRG